MNRRQVILFYLIIILALVLRLIGIHSREIQYDDAFSIFLSQQSLGNIVAGTAADTMPPLYYFTLHFWQYLGSNVAFLRILGVILSIAILIISFDLVRRVFGYKAGLWAAFFTAISPIHIYHAQDLRMYTLLVLGQISYYWFFVRLFVLEESPKRKPIFWVGLILSGVIAIYSHNLAIFGLGIANLYLLIKRAWRDFGRLLLAQLVIGLISLPWLFMVPGQLEKVQRAFWTPQPGFLEVFQAIIQFTANLPIAGVLLPIVAILSAQVFILVAIDTWRDRRNVPGIGFFIAVAALLPILLFIASYLLRPVFVARGFLVSSLAYYCLAGRLVAKDWKKGAGLFIGVAYFAAAVISLPSFYTYNDFPRSPYKAAMNNLRGTSIPDDLILHDNKLSYFPCFFYAPDLQQAFLADEPGSHNDTFAPASQVAMNIFPVKDVQTAVERRNRIFYVVFNGAIDEYKQQGNEHPQLTWLNENYHYIDQMGFNDLLIYQFEK
jgi:mannosyltransferase